MPCSLPLRFLAQSGNLGIRIACNSNLPATRLACQADKRIAKQKITVQRSWGPTHSDGVRVRMTTPLVEEKRKNGLIGAGARKVDSVGQGFMCYSDRSPNEMAPRGIKEPINNIIQDVYGPQKVSCDRE